MLYNLQTKTVWTWLADILLLIMHDFVKFKHFSSVSKTNLIMNNECVQKITAKFSIIKYNLWMQFMYAIILRWHCVCLDSSLQQCFRFYRLPFYTLLNLYLDSIYILNWSAYTSLHATKLYGLFWFGGVMWRLQCLLLFGNMLHKKASPQMQRNL